MHLRIVSRLLACAAICAGLQLSSLVVAEQGPPKANVNALEQKMGPQAYAKAIAYNTKAAADETAHQSTIKRLEAVARKIKALKRVDVPYVRIEYDPERKSPFFVVASWVKEFPDKMAPERIEAARFEARASMLADLKLASNEQDLIIAFRLSSRLTPSSSSGRLSNELNTARRRHHGHVRGARARRQAKPAPLLRAGDRKISGCQDGLQGTLGGFLQGPQGSYYALTSAHIIRPTVGQANSDIISSQAGNPFFPFIDVAVVKLAVGKNITCRHAGAFVGPNGVRKEDDPKNWAAFKTGMRTDVTMGRTVARDPSDDANVYILGDEPEFPIQTLPSNDAAVMGCLASLGCESGACSNRAEAAAKGWDSRIFCLPGDSGSVVYDMDGNAAALVWGAGWEKVSVDEKDHVLPLVSVSSNAPGRALHFSIAIPMHKVMEWVHTFVGADVTFCSDTTRDHFMT